LKTCLEPTLQRHQGPPMLGQGSVLPTLPTAYSIFNRHRTITSAQVCNDARLWMLGTRPCIPPIKHWPCIRLFVRHFAAVAKSRFLYQTSSLPSRITRFLSNAPGELSVVNIKVPTPNTLRPTTAGADPTQDAAPYCNERQASAIAELRLERASAHQRRGHACHACIH
jgi:hypothetical protein